MKYKITKSKIFTTISVIVVTIIIAMLANWFQASAEQSVINSALSEMEEVGAQYEYALESNIKEAENNISILSKYILESNITDKNFVEFLNSQAISEKFTDLYYISLDGYGISKDGSKIDFSENDAFLNSLNQNLFVTAPNISHETDIVTYYISVPIIRDGVTTAILMSKISADAFFEDYQSKTNGKGDVFIVDNNLNFVFSTSEGHIGAQTIPEGDIVEMGQHNVIEAQDNIKNSKNGGFSYIYYGVLKVMVYMPIESTEWALAMNVESRVINSELAIAVEQLQYICQGIYWFLILLILYVWIAQARSFKRLEKTAYYDTLTGLSNIKKLKQDMSYVLSKNKTKQFSVLIYDIENFKVFNEMYGYEMGDRVLKTMKEFSDTLDEPSLTFARVGADEFAMFAASEFLDDINHIIVGCMAYFDETIPELIEHNASFKCGRYKIEIGETDVDDIINKVRLAHKKAKETTGQFVCDYDNVFKLNYSKMPTLQTKCILLLLMKSSRFTYSLNSAFKTACLSGPSHLSAGSKQMVL